MKVPISFSDLTHTGKGLASSTFPLGVSYVASYALKKFPEEISAEIFKYPEDFANYLEKTNPKIACFSNYAWNSNLSCEFAKRIKQKSPGTITVFGGPDYPLDHDKQEEFLLSHPEIDFYIVREGEQAFSELLKTALQYNFDVNNIKSQKSILLSCHYIQDGKIVRGTPTQRLSNLDEIPSPYLLGLMDKFFDEKLMPLIQGTRGCPFSCTYCTEGNDYFNQIARFSKKRAIDEFDYIAQRAKVPNLGIVDSNFGMYLHDLELCNSLSEKRKKYNWPKFIDVSTGKNQKKRTMECVELLGGAMHLGASVQSTDHEVLKNIKRQNISTNEMVELTKFAETLGANSQGEVILALPGDTKQAHFKSVFDLLDAGVNLSRTYQLILLPASEVSSIESRKKYPMQTRFRVIPYCFGDYNLYGEQFSAAETEEICISSNIMSFEDYLDCRSLSLTAEIFYNSQILGELIKFLEQNNITPSKLVGNIHESVTKNPQGMQEIYQGFLEENKRDLWESRNDLKKFLQQPGIIKRYELGELGKNELFEYKGKAFFEKMRELHKVAFEEARKLLKQNNSLDEQSENYLQELHDFSLLRKQSLLSDKTETKKFHFDFVTLLKDKFDSNPFNHSVSEGIDIKISHSDEQRTLIEDYLTQYSPSGSGLGRILQKAHVPMLYRKALTV